MKLRLYVKPFVDLDAWSSWDARNCDKCSRADDCEIEAELVHAYSPERKPADFGFISKRAGKRMAISGRIQSVCGEFKR